MTESIFIKKIHVLFEHLIKIYYDGEEINNDVKAIKLLCHNWEELQKMEDVKQNKLNGG